MTAKHITEAFDNLADAILAERELRTHRNNLGERFTAQQHVDKAQGNLRRLLRAVEQTQLDAALERAAQRRQAQDYNDAA